MIHNIWVITVVFLGAVWLAPNAGADQVFVVGVDQAAVYSGPAETAVIGRLKQGRKVQSDGTEKNGFVLLKSKSTRELWVKKDDLNSAVDQELADGRDEHGRDGKKWSYNIGISSGSSAGFSYSEVDLAINYYFYPWLVLKNAPFYRFGSNITSTYGLDVSVDGVYGLDGTIAGLTLFGGPGYRVASLSPGMGFIEYGAIVKVAGINIGGGAKTFLVTPTQSQFFFLLAGGGSF